MSTITSGCSSCTFGSCAAYSWTSDYESERGRRTVTTTQVPEFTLGDRLRKSREAAGLKQEEMAEIMGVSPATISNWENGLRRPKTGEFELVKRWAEETCVP